MPTNAFKSISGIEQIVANDIREGLFLEYKSSAILTQSAVGAICKSVSALANSAGGQFITGIAAVDGRPSRLDGGFAGPSKLDWIHQIINSNTYPPLENFEVFELKDGGLYYVIDVPVSPRAPHQSNDHKYYKRRGPHSDPMEHYEIEDVRNRPKVEAAPLRVEIATENILALLQFSNSDQFSPIIDLACTVTTNFSLKSDGVSKLNTRGLRRIAPASAIAFHIGGFTEILNSNSEAEISINISYQFKGVTFKYSQVLFVGDFDGSAITRSPSVRALEALSDRLDRIVDSLKPTKQLVDLLDRAVDGSGLRLSHRTLAFLKGEGGKLSPSEFDYRGYQIVADISLDDAISIDRVFNTFGGVEPRRLRYEKLREDLRLKFEQVFEVEPFFRAHDE